jgi:peptidoglycan/xylan/chitin deacetylase (PgdA/CDA1 family)
VTVSVGDAAYREQKLTERRLQKAVLTAIGLTQTHRLLGRLASGAGAILTFHRVRPAPSAGFAPNAHLEVTPEFLGNLIDWAKNDGLDIVTLDEAKRRLSGGPHRRFLVLTFDDGYRDNLEFALPVLRQRNCPFTIYVATGFIERRANPWWMTLEAILARTQAVELPDFSRTVLPTSTLAEKRAAFEFVSSWLQEIAETNQRSVIDQLAERYGLNVRDLLDEAFLDWTELKQIAAEPLATIGGHTDGHFALAKLSAVAASREIELGTDLLERHLGTRPKHFSYPYGFDSAAGSREQDIARNLGFSTAVLTKPGVLRQEDLLRPTAWPRVSMNGHFQSVAYAKVLASGVPFLPGHLMNGRTEGRPESEAA